jgi:hypothetical protein
MNTSTALGSGMSLEEWKSLAFQLEKSGTLSEDSKMSHQQEFDAIPQITPDLIPNESSSSSKVYRAHMYCTDNDFLENSKIRAFFKNNALSPDDAKLFDNARIPHHQEEIWKITTSLASAASTVSRKKAARHLSSSCSDTACS